VTSRTKPLAVLIVGFALLGMPGAALGVAWPSMASELDRALGDLGILTVATGLSYAAVSFGIGGMTRRFQAGRLLIAAAVAAAVGLVVYAVSDSWVWTLAASVPLGASGGVIDSIGNAFVAVTRGPRAMGAIHAAFGFGAMLAPLLITGLVALGASWRIGLAMIAAAEVVLALSFAVVRSAIRMPAEGTQGRPARLGSRRILGMSVWVFFIYVGVEGSTSLWAFTLLTEGQGVSDVVAGFAVAAHWGALFASRLLLTIVGDRLEPNRTITASVVTITVALALMWWNPAVWVTVAGLIIAGFANGPVFPFEMLLTPGRVGAEFTPWIVGYQLSAATVSLAIVPAVIGILVNVRGPLVIAPVLVGLAVATALSTEALRHMSAGEVTKAAIAR
jgi:fucose permease